MSNENKQEKKGKALKIVVIILLFIIVIAGAGFAGYYSFVNKKPNNNNQQVVNNQQANVNANSNNYGVRNLVSSYTYDLEEFLVNLSDKDGKRYLKTKIVIGYEKKKFAKELEQKKPMMRDVINNILRGKKSADFTQKGVEEVKKEILEKINPMFLKGRVDNVYFYDILVQ